ncbi:DUF1682-domain-containing protein [Sodiomyces alkalinus F11]|uniref:DUF1682-domain-containing protein n=1 Tax=Sodiomyces alkalinus (strain CBS 110278 / VKM F-3762 / F11) TaxID=1314773 RepID=A0A3N2PV36_SODAK|nr:DUF1682-domain-containing protein [Sodiomyces alkalinus F11]ROT38334.1 DUF1682-domain-containing protein [Sodiomyces alkalinus F11]
MANVLNGLFGGGKSSETPLPSADSDFADFAGAPDPVPTDTPTPLGSGAAPAAATPAIASQWYEVHKRHTIDEFKFEGLILGIGLVLFMIHLVGARLNRNRAKAWAKANAPVLKREFASVGFSGLPTMDAAAAAGDDDVTTGVLKEKSLFQFASYASGRQNVAFVDVDLTLVRRFNPMLPLAETVLSFFWESMAAPRDVVEAVLYPFDGKESLAVPAVPGTHELRSKEGKSAFDGFVWAIVSKERMKELREERYDLSITFTKDNSKLPNWVSVMSESAEITEQLLTPELIKAVEAAGDAFEYLVISDQPVEKPKTVEEATTARKRIFLRYNLPSNNDYSSLMPLFEEYIRLTDTLVAHGKFRGEVMRKVNKVRDETISQLRKEAEAKEAEERTQEREKAKKAKRDQELAALDAKQQKKYLEKEREKEQRRMAKKQTVRA